MSFCAATVVFCHFLSFSLVFFRFRVFTVVFARFLSFSLVLLLSGDKLRQKSDAIYIFLYCNCSSLSFSFVFARFASFFACFLLFSLVFSQVWGWPPSASRCWPPSSSVMLRRHQPFGLLVGLAWSASVACAPPSALRAAGRLRLIWPRAAISLWAAGRPRLVCFRFALQPMGVLSSVCLAPSACSRFRWHLCGHSVSSSDYHLLGAGLLMIRFLVVCVLVPSACCCCRCRCCV